MSKIKSNNKVKKNLSLQMKIFVLVTFLILISITSQSYISHTDMKETVNNTYEENTKKSLNHIMSLTSMFINNAEENINRISENRDMKDFLSENYKNNVVSVLKNYQENNENIQSVYISTANKKFYMYPEVELPEGFDATTRSWYLSALKSKNTVWTEPYIDASTKKLIISVAKPVYEQGTKNFIGVVGMDFSLDVIKNLAQEEKIGETGYIVVLNKSNKIMTHPISDLIDQEIPVPELKKEVVEAKEGYLEYTYEGSDKISIFNTLDKTGWKFVGIISKSEIKGELNNLLIQNIITGIIVLIISIILGFVISKTISKPIKQLTEDVQKIGNGDFTIQTKVRTKDEVGILSESINKTVDNLRKLIVNIQSVSMNIGNSANTLAANAEETSASSEEVSNAISEIAVGASKQAESTTEGSYNTKQLVNRFSQLNDATEEMLSISEQVNKTNEKGSEIVESLLKETELNKQYISEIETVILSLNKQVSSIGSILDTITDISQQTNLLSLNAAIEAARAGEHGRGFAVVADEVRKLSEQSSSSTKNIQGIINTVQKESANAVETMRKVKSQNDSQVLSVDNVGDSFNEILGGVENMSKKIEEINNVIKELTVDSDKIAESIESIAAISEQTAASSQEVSASVQETVSAIEYVAKTAEELNELSNQLNDNINVFKINKEE